MRTLPTGTDAPFAFVPQRLSEHEAGILAIDVVFAGRIVLVGQVGLVVAKAKIELRSDEPILTVVERLVEQGGDVGVFAQSHVAAPFRAPTVEPDIAVGQMQCYVLFGQIAGCQLQTGAHGLAGSVFFLDVIHQFVRIADRLNVVTHRFDAIHVHQLANVFVHQVHIQWFACLMSDFAAQRFGVGDAIGLYAHEADEFARLRLYFVLGHQAVVLLSRYGQCGNLTRYFRFVHGFDAVVYRFVDPIKLQIADVADIHRNVDVLFAQGFNFIGDIALYQDAQ